MDASSFPPVSAQEPFVDIFALPTELLLQIFQHLSFRNRLACVSFVCKRWRKAVLQSVRALKRYQKDRLPELLALCPGLTILKVDGRVNHTLLPSLPPNLATLRFTEPRFKDDEDAESKCSLRLFSHMSTLTWLETYTHANCPSLAALLLSSRYSLSSLTLFLGDSGTSTQFLEALHFPALTSFATGVELQVLLPFLRNHSSQLTFLQLNDIAKPLLLESFLAGIAFPRLHELELSRNVPYLPELLRNSPKSVALRLRCWWSTLKRHLSIVSPVLETLVLEGPASSDEDFIAAMTACPRLRWLALKSPPLAATGTIFGSPGQPPPAYCSRITTLEVVITADLITAVLCAFTSVREMMITVGTHSNNVVVPAPSQQLRELSFPHLTDLAFYATLRPGLVLEYLTLMTMISPRLTSVYCDWLRTEPPPPSEDFNALIRLMDSRGVRFFSGPFSGPLPQTNIMTLMPGT